jgi:hypothetical protein
VYGSIVHNKKSLSLAPLCPSVKNVATEIGGQPFGPRGGTTNDRCLSLCENACNSRDEHENAIAADWNNIIIPQVFQ